MRESFFSDGDPLVQSLRLAEPVAPPPRVTPSRLLEAAKERQRRATRIRLVSATLVIAAAGAFVLHASWNDEAYFPIELAQSPPIASVDAIQAELARLQQEASIHEAVVRGVERTRSLRRWREAFTQVPPAYEETSVAQESARTAAISWRYAVIIERELGDRATAIYEYRRVAERFAGTEWAQLAADSLKRLDVPSEQPPAL